MTRFLLDTNVISEQRKGDRANPGVRSWFDNERDSEIWISVLVVGELQRGVELIARRDAQASVSLGAWLDKIVDDYADRILDVDLAVASAWASLGVPDPIPVVDGLHAATALHHDLTLVTRNQADVASTGVRVLNPFEVAQ